MSKKSRNQIRDKAGRKKGGISEATAIAGAMAGGAIGATIAAAVTTGEVRKRLVKFISPSKNKKRKRSAG